jgi:hypothetical protein
MKFTLAFLMLLALAAQSPAATKFKIDSVPAKYKPSCGGSSLSPSLCTCDRRTHRS